jgi:hypothetical protein
MNVPTQNFLQSFEFLPDFEKQKSASEIIKRNFESNLTALSEDDLISLSEDDLISLAEELFLELDQRESKNSSVK